MTATLATGVRVRRAALDDLDWLVQELKAFSEFIQTVHQVYDPEYALAGMRMMCGQHLVLIAEQDGERLGFIAGLVGAHPFNPKLRFLTEVFWWVSAQHRRSRAGLLLLNAFIEEGRRSADLIVMSLETNSGVREETLTRRGFRLKERGYLMEV